MRSDCKYRWNFTFSSTTHLTSCCVAQVLTGHRPGSLGVGDPCIILNEISQLQKDKYYMILLMLLLLSHFSCVRLCDPIDGSPPGYAIPGILQARTLEWVAISFSNAWKWKVKVKSLNHVRLLATPWTAAHRLLHPWDFPGKSTGVGCHCLLCHCNLHEP